MGDQGCSWLRTPRRWRHGALSSARDCGQWSHGKGGPRASHSPLPPSPAQHRHPWVPQEPPAPQTQQEPFFWGRDPRPDPNIPHSHPCHAHFPPTVPVSPCHHDPPAPCPLSPGTHRYWKGATVAVTGWLCGGPEEKVMAPDPNTGLLPCEPLWGSFPILAIVFLGDLPNRPPPLPCTGGALGSSVGSSTSASLLLLPAASGHFPGDTGALAGCLCPARGGAPGLPSLPSALPAPLGLRVLGPGASAFPGWGDGVLWGTGSPEVLGEAAACGLAWATARGTGMAET